MPKQITTAALDELPVGSVVTSAWMRHLTPARAVRTEGGWTWIEGPRVGVAVAEDELPALRLGYARAAMDAQPGRDVNAEADALREVADVLSDDWLQGKVLPAVVGAVEKARLQAIGAIVARVLGEN